MVRRVGKGRFMQVRILPWGIRLGSAAEHELRTALRFADKSSLSFDRVVNMSSHLRNFGRILWRCLLVFWTLVLFSPLILKIIGDMTSGQ
jgi:hypothetical protein